MSTSKWLGTLAATAAVIAVGVAALPGQAQAYWIWRGGVRVWVPGAAVVVAPPVVYARPPAVVVAPPQRVWVPEHWRNGYLVPGHCA
jgi:hypothetical protein